MPGYQVPFAFFYSKVFLLGTVFKEHLEKNSRIGKTKKMTAQLICWIKFKIEQNPLQLKAMLLVVTWSRIQVHFFYTAV